MKGSTEEGHFIRPGVAGRLRRTARAKAGVKEQGVSVFSGAGG